MTRSPVSERSRTRSVVLVAILVVILTTVQVVVMSLRSASHEVTAELSEQGETRAMVAQLQRETLDLGTVLALLGHGQAVSDIDGAIGEVAAHLAEVRAFAGSDLDARAADDVERHLAAIESTIRSVVVDEPGRDPHMDPSWTQLLDQVDGLERAAERLYDEEERRYGGVLDRVLQASRQSQDLLIVAGLAIVVLGLAVIVSSRRSAHRALALAALEADERADAEAALREAEARYRSVVESVSEVVFETDTTGRWTTLTSGWEKISGHAVADTIGCDARQHLHADDREVVCQLLDSLVEGGTPTARGTLRLWRRDGGLRWVEVSCRGVVGVEGTVTGIVGTLHDVTDRQTSEVEQRHAQKLESVGMLAAGIAHEINTPIQFIGDNVHFLNDAFVALTDLLRAYRGTIGADTPIPWEERKRRINDAEARADADYLEQEFPAAIAQALGGVERVSTIVRAMKAFGHPDGVDKRAVDLNEAIQNTIIVARNELKYVADVETRLDELPLVVCHPGDLSQVFLNLLVNAAHAIADRSDDVRGRITVTTRAVDDAVEIEVADTGCGIPPSIRDRIFDPFFTTKAVGRGTGQGLALTRAIIVERHGGTIDVDSEEGVGTTFRLRIPRAATAAAAA